MTADERLDELIKTLDFLADIFYGYGSTEGVKKTNHDLKETIRILTALKSENIEKWVDNSHYKNDGMIWNLELESMIVGEKIQNEKL